MDLVDLVILMCLAGFIGFLAVAFILEASDVFLWKREQRLQARHVRQSIRARSRASIAQAPRPEGTSGPRGARSRVPLPQPVPGDDLYLDPESFWDSALLSLSPSVKAKFINLYGTASKPSQISPLVKSAARRSTFNQ